VKAVCFLSPSLILKEEVLSFFFSSLLPSFPQCIPFFLPRKTHRLSLVPPFSLGETLFFFPPPLKALVLGEEFPPSPLRRSERKRLAPFPSREREGSLSPPLSRSPGLEGLPLTKWRKITISSPPFPRLELLSFPPFLLGFSKIFSPSYLEAR